jgi:hypothetical protein
MPIAFFKNGVCVPLVTTPAFSPLDVDVVAVPADGALEHLEPDQLARGAVGLLLLQDVVARGTRPSSSRRSS